ncbi:Cytochrome P450 [Penicillium italicum]|uniref:Cytochrome P450 n=1 Tax=Penicillium italicum TaxID=40296 RepID=A0A0A2L6U0_PENIT|nr:Cytochrome P450 [Penicillium italicum]
MVTERDVSDTNASAIRETVLHIITNPRVYSRLQREIDDTVCLGHAPSVGEGLVAATQARNLPYLQAVIREALEKIYGKDADDFRPERWLESDPAKLAFMVRTNNLTFGHSRFQCLGKAVAKIEITKAVFELLRNFDLTLVNPTRPRNYLECFAISNLWVQVMDRTPCSP